MGRPARQAPLEHAIADPVRARRRVLITGAEGQLGRALAEAFSAEDVVALGRSDWDVTESAPPGLGRPDVVLHAAAWTDVDRAESEPEACRAVNEDGARHAAELGAPVVYFSTDYVFDGRKGAPYVESDEPHPLSVYARSKLAGERYGSWVVRSSWLFGPVGRNFVRTMLALGRERSEVSVVEDQRGCPTYVGHLAEAVRRLVELPRGIWHVSADGDCTWADFAEAIFEEAQLDCRVRRTTSGELGRPAPRPPSSVLRSERVDAPRLPDWREGLRACLARLEGRLVP